MEKIVFSVQGSSDEPYEVVFTRGDVPSVTCTCKAGMLGTYCKHRIRILEGLAEGIVSGNADRIPDVLAWLVDSEIARAVAELQRAESDFDAAKKRVDSAKRFIARAMAG